MNIQIFKFFPRSFKNQIALLIATLGFITVLTDLVVSLVNQYQFFTQTIEKNINIQFSISHQILMESLLFKDIYTLNNLVTDISNNMDYVDNIYVLDQNKKLITDAQISKIFPEKIDGLSRLQYCDIKANNQTIGQLVFLVNNNPIKSMVINQLIKGFTLNIIVVGFGIIAGIKFAHYLSKPLDNLVVEIKEHPNKIRPINEGSGFQTKEVSLLRETLIETFETLKLQRQEIIKNEKQAFVGTMSAGLAHELKNPIMTIKFLIYQALHSPEDEDTKEDLKVIQKESNRLVDLINEFLEFARPIKTTFTEFELRDLFAELEDYNIALQNGLELNLVLDHDISIVSDYNKLLQVLQNLLNNSFESKATRVTVYIEDKIPFVEIRIKDNGIGINTQDIPLIFHPFFTTKSNGTGLGLSMSQMIMETLGGDLQFNKENKKGAEFSLTIRNQT